MLVGLPAAATDRAKAVGNVLGDATAPVKVEVYADFQCPACGQFDRTSLREIEDKYVKNGKVQVIFNHYAFIGDESTRAAEASECANDQGKFWEYADTLFNNQAGENQGAFSDANLEKFAQQVGLDMDKYKTCMQQRPYLSKIQSFYSEWFGAWRQQHADVVHQRADGARRDFAGEVRIDRWSVVEAVIPG